VAEIADAWKRPGCSEFCWKKPALVSGEHDKRLIEVHDVDAHEAYARALSVTPVIETGPLVIDRRMCTATVCGQRIHLMAREYGLLLALAESLGSMCSREHLLARAWGSGYEHDYHVLRVTVARLRGKLGSARNLIETNLMHGYVLHAVTAGADAPTGPLLSPGLTVYVPRPGLGPRQEELLRILQAVPDHRLSVASAAAQVFGFNSADTRHRVRDSASGIKRPVVVKERLGPLPGGGEIWIEEGTS
jgi:DNA-binding winged helix-turn-helix (wHTH) protein